MVTETYKMAEYWDDWKLDLPGARERLYKAYELSMLAECLHVLADDRQKATTALHEGFLQLFKQKDSFTYKGDNQARAYLRKLMIHICLNMKRKTKTAQKRMPIAPEKEGEDCQVHPADSMLLVDDILAIVAQVPGKTGEVMQLAIKGFKVQEIAEKLGISESTSKWHIGHGRKQLNELFKKNGLPYGTK